MIDINIKTLENFTGLELPYYATPQSAGLDLSAAIDENIVIAPGEFKLINSGLAIELPSNMEAQIRPRSGLAAKHGVTILNSPGTIDTDYRGEIKIILINHGRQDFVVTRGLRIAQMVIAKFEQVNFVQKDELTKSIRGAAGFGSTGQ